MGGIYADPINLAAVSTLLATIMWPVVWVTGFNLGLAHRLEIGVYDERIGACTNRIFDTWIKQLAAQLCQSLVSRTTGRTILPVDTNRSASDVEGVRGGFSNRSDPYPAAANGPRIPPQSGVVSPLSLARDQQVIHDLHQWVQQYSDWISDRYNPLLCVLAGSCMPASNSFSLRLTSFSSDYLAS